MNFSNLAFIITDDCNYNCSYCRLKKEKKYMTSTAIEKAIAFFYPFLSENAYIIFYGGEPLLAFDKIKHAVSLLQEKDKKGGKKLKFSVTTNGSLLNNRMLDFFDHHGFYFTLSFDGLIQDTCRKSGSMASIVELIKGFRDNLYPGIVFSVNSVFTPETVGYLSESLQYILAAGPIEIQLSFAQDQPWKDSALSSLANQLERLRDFLVSYHKKMGMVPVSNFRPSPSYLKNKNVFFCDGGRSRIAVTPEENLWGCLHFHGYLKDKEDSSDFRTYSFGKLEDFIEDHNKIYPRVLANYSTLRQDCFFTSGEFCFLCREVENCGICPVTAAYSTGFIGKIPPWMCSLNRILRNEKETFVKEI